MWSISQGESRSKSLLQPDILQLLSIERDFTGVVYPYVTEKEKIGPETRADDIKNDVFNREICGSMPLDSE